MMNYYYQDPAAAAPCSFYNDNTGEAAAAVQTTGGTSSLFADMVADCSTDDLFELVWEQGEVGQTGGGALSASMQPALSCLWSPRFSSKPPPADLRFDPPSENEMAAWLGTIVRGDKLIASCTDDDDGGGRRPMADDCRRSPGVVVPATRTMGTSTETDKKEKVPTMGTSTEMGKKEKVPTTTTTVGMMMMGNNKETRKQAPAGGSSSRRSHSHHGEAHNLTEKRRRQKINERLKTLQQLVPGCRKSNQASTLDRTIHYMKLLQHQVQAMSSVGLAAPPPVYPVVQPQCVPPGTPPVAMPFPAAPMVPFGATMLQLPHYPTTASVMMMPAAAVAHLYPAHQAPATTSTAVAPGDAMSANLLHGSS